MTEPTFLTEILHSLPQGQIVDLLIGCRWTAVLALPASPLTATATICPASV